MMPTIADHAVRIMRECDITIVMWGDGVLTTIGDDAGVKARHPLDVMGAVLAGLSRDKARFEPCYIRGHDSAGRSRKVRGFKLKEEAHVPEIV